MSVDTGDGDKQMCDAGPQWRRDRAGVEAVPEAAPISRWTIPLAALSEQEGGGSPALTLMVLPPGPLSVPETHVLLQLVAPRTQADRRSKADQVRERRGLPCCSMEEPWRNYVRADRAGQGKNPAASRRVSSFSTVTCQPLTVEQLGCERGELVEKLPDHHFGGAVYEPLADGGHRASDLRVALVRDQRRGCGGRSGGAS